MCYAIPGKVKGFDGKFVIVDYFGEERRAINEVTGLQLGDYLYAQGGFVITRVGAEEAEKTLETWKDLFFELQEIDRTSSQLSPWGGARSARTRSMLDKILAGGTITHEDIVYLLEIRDPAEREFLLSAANHLRQRQHGNSCCVHGIIEISNHCAERCAYCGISFSHQGLLRYRMSDEEILKAVRAAVEDHGFKALVLQSGEDPGRTIDDLVRIVNEIRRRFGVLVFISFGELGRTALARLYEAGARGLLLRFETSDPDMYARLHPGSVLDDRLAELRHAYELGYLILTGSLVGLPGQTKDMIARDIALAGELHVEMLSVGPFIPHPATPLASLQAPSAEQIVQTLAAARFTLHPDVKILVTTGLETISSLARREALMAGANSMMLNVTPVKRRALYDIYPGRAHTDDAVGIQIADTVALLEGIGRAPTDLSIGLSQS